MKRNFKVVMLYMRNSIMAQMEYRINFISSVLFELAYFFVKLTYVFVVVSTEMEIDRFGPYHIVVFIGVYTVITGLFVFISPGIFSFSKKVYSGELDFYLTKPISPLITASFSKCNLGSSLANVGSGIFLTAWGISKLDKIRIQDLGLGLLLICVGLILSYFMFLLPQLLSFWVLKVDKLNSTLWSLWDFNNMPMMIYPNSIRFLGIYLIPVFLITNPAGYSLVGNPQLWLTISMFVVTMALYGLFLVVWKRGIKRYHSSNIS